MMALARLFLLWMLVALACRAGADVVTLTADSSAVSLNDALVYLEDPTGMLGLAAVTAAGRQHRWHETTADTLNFGYTDSVYWVRFQVTAAPGVTDERLLVLDYPVLDNVQVYIRQPGQPTRYYHFGDRLPYGQRLIDHPTFIVPVPLTPGIVTHVYLRVESSSSMQIPLTLWHPQAFIAHNYEESVGRGMYYGAMIVMALYNLLLFIAVRDRSYLYYVIYVLSMTCLLGGIHGVTFKFLWPATPGLHDLSLVLSLAAMVASTVLFTRRFLSLARTRPFLARLLRGCAIVALAFALGAFFLPYRVMMMATLTLGIVAISLNFLAGILRWLDGFEPARYYNLAWSLMLGGSLILAFNKMGLIPRVWFTENAGVLGASAEVVLLSFALANRMNRDRRLRTEAQQETACAQRALLETQIRLNEDLDREVRERTEALEAANAKLREISTTDALTQLRNRRYFDEIFVQEYNRAVRERTPLSVLMIDLDHFKALNDCYGHPAGDACLIRAGALVSGKIRRPPDVAARFGGEEFVILLPNTDHIGALYVAEELRREFEKTRVAWNGLALEMTVSIGVAGGAPEGTDGHEALLQAADERLYLAKKHGRNCVR